MHYAEAELYNPKNGKWTQTGPMSEPRAGQAAALLPGTGWVLATGGTSDRTSEVFEPVLGQWVPTGSMSTPRTGATATVLSDGNVLTAGGTGNDGAPQATAEVYENSAGPLVAFSPGNLTFGGQQVGTTGPVQNVTVTNDGTADLHVGGIDITGADPGDFVARGRVQRRDARLELLGGGAVRPDRDRSAPGHGGSGRRRAGEPPGLRGERLRSGTWLVDTERLAPGRA